MGTRVTLRSVKLWPSGEGPRAPSGRHHDRLASLQGQGREASQRTCIGFLVPTPLSSSSPFPSTDQSVRSTLHYSGRASLSSFVRCISSSHNLLLTETSYCQQHGIDHDPSHFAGTETILHHGIFTRILSGTAPENGNTVLPIRGRAMRVLPLGHVLVPRLMGLMAMARPSR